MTRKGLALLVLPLCLAACGKSADLEPQKGQAAPPKAYGQTEEWTTEQLLTSSPQARPGRSDELLRRSERRDSDEFDLPPGKEPKVEASAEAPEEDTPAAAEPENR